MLNELIPLQTVVNTFIPRSRTVGSVAYTLYVWSRLSAPVESSTRYTTPGTTVEIGIQLLPWNNNNNNNAIITMSCIIGTKSFSLPGFQRRKVTSEKQRVLNKRAKFGARNLLGGPINPYIPLPRISDPFSLCVPIENFCCLCV